MKKLLSTAVAGLIFVGTANAQGTWYTDYDSWLAEMTSIGGTAEYNALTAGNLEVTSIIENGVTLSNNSIQNNLWGVNSQGTPLGQISSASNTDTLTFTFDGNAFGGRFLTVDMYDLYVGGKLTFSTSDGSEYKISTGGGLSAPFTFIGYISDGSDAISLDLVSTTAFAAVDSFTFGTNASNPGSAVPEPGEYVGMAILGVGLCGMLVRSRRIKKS